MNHTRRSTASNSRLSANRRRQKCRKLVIEELDSRQLLAADFQLLKDINEQPGVGDISNLLAIGDTLYFSATNTNGIHGLWRTDGTNAGTTFVKAISNEGNFTNVNGKLFFVASDSQHGLELWKSDGTASGTALVRDIRPGQLGSGLNSLINVNGELFFNASDGAIGRELWKSDGTASGTMVVKDIKLGDGGSTPFSLTDVNGELFFQTNMGDSQAANFQLWKSNGTENGTVLVKDLGEFDAQDLTSVGSTLFFNAYEPDRGMELWKSNGSTAGTLPVTDLMPEDSDPSELTNLNGILFFSARATNNSPFWQLWMSDGTVGGTSRVDDNAIFPTRLTNVSGNLFFSASPPDAIPDRELWKSDGSSGGTVLVKDILPGNDGSNLYNLTNINGKLYFTANDATHGNELWRSDGTESGTVLAKDFTDDSSSSDPSAIVQAGGHIYVRANNAATGTELFVSHVAFELSAHTIEENQPAGSTVGTLSSAQDPNHTTTYTLVAGAGADNNSLFTIDSNGILKANTTFDFESKSSYAIRVRATDTDGLFDDQTFVINVVDVNESPTGLTLSSNTIAENRAVGTSIGNFSSADPDPSNTFTYTLVQGTGSDDNEQFSIDGSGNLLSAASYDFETKNSFAIRVRSTDQGGQFAEQTFTIYITGVNDAPAILHNTGLNANQGAFYVITPAILEASDQDNPPSELTYRVTVQPNHGQLQRLNAGTWSSLAVEGTFTQADINAGSIRFEHDNSSLPSDTFQFALTDGNAGVPIRRISVNSSNVEGNNRSLVGGKAISGDGRFMVYESNASNLTANPVTISTGQVYLYDRQTGQTELISSDGEGRSGNLSSFGPSISANGRFVVYLSSANNLVSGDTNNKIDAFVFDREAGLTTRVSVNSNGIQGDGYVGFVSIAGDGQTVLFTSNSTNVDATATSYQWSLYAHDMSTHQTTRIVEGQSYGMLSDNGHYLAYSDTVQVYLLNRQSGQSTLVSHDGQGNGGDSYSEALAISASGRYVTFESYASNLVPSDANPNWNVYVYDAQMDTIDRVSQSSSGVEGNDRSLGGYGISADDRRVAFESDATNLVSGDTNSLMDAFVHDRISGETTRISVNGFGNQANGDSFGPSISASGRFATFSSTADNLVAGDTNGAFDVFLVDLDVSRTQIPVDVFVNVNRAPIAIALTTTSIDENSAIGSTVGKLVTTDPDGNDTFSYALVSGTGSVDNGSFTIDANGNLKSAASFDFEQKSSYSIRVRSTDQNGLSFEQTFTIQVVNVNDIPVIAHNTGLNVNQGTTTVLTPSILEAVDQDNTADQLTFSVSSLPAQGELQKSITGTWVPLVINSSFTQADINAGKIRFLHNGNSTSDDNFTFTVTDGAVLTTRVSVDSNGNQGLEQHSHSPSTSADGRFVAFVTGNGIDARDTNGGVGDIYVHDSLSGQTTLVSLGLNEAATDNFSFDPSVSADGRFIVFSSAATNLVEGDTNNSDDIFLFDRQTQVITRLSIDNQGNQGNSYSDVPVISQDGRFIAYHSLASNLVDGDNNNAQDIFLFDRQTSTTTRLSVNDAGIEGNDHSFRPTFSGNARYVAFASAANNLVLVDNNNEADIFLYDRQDNHVTRIPGNLYNQYKGVSLSEDGRYAVFSSGQNLVANDTNNVSDIFLYDMQSEQIERVSVDSAGTQSNANSYDPSISGDGRFITYHSTASNFVANDANNVDDVFLFDRLTSRTIRISADASGNDANGFSVDASISYDARFITYFSNATNLVEGDTNDRYDVFVYDRLASQVPVAVSVNISVNQAPTNFLLSNSSLAENQPTGSNVGTFSNVVPNIALTYTLVSGVGADDNAAFTIDSNGNLQNFASFDFESKNSYSIRVRATAPNSGGLYLEKTFTILVTNVNESPTAKPDQAVATKDASGFIDIDVTANDTDLDGERLTLTVQSFTQPAHGVVVAVSGNRQLSYKPAAGFSGDDSFSYTLVDVGGLVSTTTVGVTVADNVQVVDSNPATVATSLQSAINIVAGTPTQVLVNVNAGNINAVADAVRNLQASAPVSVFINTNYGTYSEVSFSAPANVHVIMDGHAGQVTLVGGSPALIIEGGSIELRNGVFLTNATDAPTILVLGGTLLLRNTTIEESITATRPAIEVRGGQLDLGTTNSPGINTLIARGPGDFILNTSSSQIPAFGNTFYRDSQLATEQEIESGITDGSDNATYGFVDRYLPTSQITTAAASLASGSFNIAWSGSDIGSGVASYDISVSINGGAYTPWLTHTTFTNAIYPGRTGTIYSFTSLARDAAGLVQLAPSAPVTITVFNGQPLLNDQSLTIAERSVVGTSVGTVVATDPDSWQSLTYSIESGNTNDTFTINASTGVISVANNTLLNFATNPSFALTVKVTDNGNPSLFDSGLVNVQLTNVNDAPTVANPLANVTVKEDAINSTIDLSQVFADMDDATLNFSVVSSENSKVDATISGALLTLRYPANANGIASITVTATDSGNLSASSAFSVTINPVNDAPAVVNPLGNLTVDESATASTINLLGVFADLDDASLTYSASSSNTSQVTTSVAGGVLTLAYAPHRNGQADITVTAIDSGNLSVSTVFHVTVINSLPTVTVSAPLDGFAGVAGQARVLRLNAVDATDNQTNPFSYEILWGDGSPLQVVSGPATLDVGHVYSTTGTKTVQVRTIDPDGGASPQQTRTLTIVRTELQGTLLAVGGNATDDALVFTSASIAPTATLTLNTVSLGSFTIPASGVMFFGGLGNDTLTMNGTAGNDVFSTDGSSILWNRSAIWPQPVRLQSSGVEKLRVVALGGNDTITILSGTADIDGGTGTDRLVGPDMDSLWNISSSNAGTLNGGSFTGVESLSGGLGNDSFAFGTTGLVTGQILGGGGIDQLNYAARSTPVTINLQALTATATAGWQSIESVVGSSSLSDTIIGRNAANQWTITGADQGSLNTNELIFAGLENLTGGSLNDAFSLSGTTSQLSGIVQGAGGTDVLNYSAITDTVQVNLATSKATRVGSIAGLESFVGSSSIFDTLIGIDGSNTWSLLGLNAGTVRTTTFDSMEILVGGSSTDTFNFGSPTAAVTGLINGGGGLDTLLSPNLNNSWVIDRVGGGSLNGIRFETMENLTGNNSSDLFQVASGGQILGTILGGTQLTGQRDVLSYSTFNASVTVDLQFRSSNAVASFNGIEEVRGATGQSNSLMAADTSNAWSIIGTNTGGVGAMNFVEFNTLVGGALADIFTLGVAGAISGSIDGSDGVDTLTGPNINTSWLVSGPNQGQNQLVALFQDVENLTGGTASDNFAFGTIGSLLGVINAGAGIDTIDFSAVPGPLDIVNTTIKGVAGVVGGFSAAENVVGSADTNDRIVGIDVATTWQITSTGAIQVGGVTYTNVEALQGGNLADTLVGPSVLLLPVAWVVEGVGEGSISVSATTIRFGAVEHITGGTTDDSFELQPAGRITGNINGGTGNNSLSYESWTSNVSVNLASALAGNATAVSGIVSNITVVNGGFGNDILLGNAAKSNVLIGGEGNDTLTGSSTRDILIGGLGVDTITGAAGDDILIAGSTQYDRLRSALLAILAEWTNTARTFTVRANNIAGTGTGTRLNGSNFLNIDSVFNDPESVDSLTGGSNQDWFFAEVGEITDFIGSGTTPDRRN